MPYLGMDLDAKKKIPLVANALGMHPGIVAWGLLNLWEYCWANGVEVVSELVLSGCVGDVRLPEVLEAYGFLERVPKGWTSEITTQPIPADAWRVRGAKKYLNLKAGNSKGGHAAKGNLIPGGPKRVRSAGAEGEPRGSPAESSARPRPFTQHPAPSTHDQDQSQHLAGAFGDPPGTASGGEGGQPPPPAEISRPGATSGTTGAVFELSATPQSRQRKPSAQEEFATWAAGRSGRIEKLGRSVWVHVADGLKEYGAERMRAAYEVFLADKWARGLDPPCPMRAFAAPTKLAEYISAADRIGPPAPGCEVCGGACRFKEHGHDLCEECRYRRKGDLLEAGWEWTPGTTEEQMAADVTAWIERERAQRGAA